MTNINFGTVDPTQGVVTPASGTLSFTCQNDAYYQTAYVTACLNIGVGSGTSTTPRSMSNGSSQLNFQLYKDAALSQIWGSIATPATPPPTPMTFTIPGATFFGGVGQYQSPDITVFGALAGPQVSAGAGPYNNAFSGADAFLTGTVSNGGPYPPSCGGGTSGIPFPFTVSALVSKSCTVAAGPTLNLGNPAGVDAALTNITGSNSINVTCTNGTPYFVGLAPSNTSTTGAGLMAGSGSNSDKIPYQLRSTAGMAGTIWGNTATSTSVGNGVAGTGNGNSQLLTVYATTPSADFTPDTYTDVVTINVNY
jgi:spore coat protein U-like protein